MELLLVRDLAVIALFACMLLLALLALGLTRR